MHKSEQEVKDKLEQEGWTVYRNGWPDFAALKNGVLRLIEVKATGELSEEQIQMFALLKKLLGVEVEVLKPLVYRPQRSSLQQLRQKRKQRRLAFEARKKARRIAAA